MWLLSFTKASIITYYKRYLNPPIEMEAFVFAKHHSASTMEALPKSFRSLSPLMVHDVAKPTPDQEIVSSQQ